MKTLGQFLEEAKATYCGRCGTRHVPPAKGGTCPALKEETEIEDAGTPNEFRKQKIVHKGEHVATIHTYRGRAGGWVSSAHTPDGKSASKKYGIGLMDTKKEMISKIKNYHKGN